MNLKSYPLALFAIALLINVTYAGNDKPNGTLRYGYIENKGQIHDQNGNLREDVRYIFADETFKVILRKEGFSYEWVQASYVSSNNSESNPVEISDDPESRQDFPVQFTTNRIDIDFVNANQNIQIVSDGESPFYRNYFKDYTGPQGIKRVRSFEKVTYQNVYDGIDLVFTTVKHQDGKTYPEYQFVVRPEGNIGEIALSYRGMDQLGVVNNGSLQINVPLGVANETKPLIIMSDGSSKDGSFIQNGNVISFDKVKGSKGQTFVIDPTIQWSTYWGGTAKDLSDELATDSDGNCYVTGRVRSTTDIATAGAYQTVWAGGIDIPLMKWDPNGSLLYSTYYGGHENEIGFAIVIDLNDEVWIGGHTFSSDGIATLDAEVDTFAGPDFDGNISRFSADGDLEYGSYYGGPGQDEIQEMAVGEDGYIYASGFAESLYGIILTSGYKVTGDTMGDATLAKYDPVTGYQVWCTYWGGDKRDRGHGITVYKNSVYWGATVTSSTNITFGSNIFQTTFGGGDGDMMLSRWTLDGYPVWATYWGGPGGERNRDIRADRDGNFYVTGQTESGAAGLATPGTWKTSFVYSSSNRDGLLGKWDSSGNRIWSTYYGGNNIDMPRSLRVGKEGAPIYIGGYTKSDSGFVTKNNAYDKKLGTPNDAFWLRFNWDGSLLQYSTYFGGKKNESVTEPGWYGPTMEVDIWNNVFLTSGTNSPDAIAINAFKDTLALTDQYDIFLAKFADPCPDAFEPNDDFNKATTLKFRGGNSISWNAPIAVKNDKDYYSFVTSVDQGNVKIDLTGLAYDANLYVYDLSHTEIAKSKQSGNVDESVTLNGLALGTYYILVKSPTHEFLDGVCYSLTITASSTAFRLEDEVTTSVRGNISLYPNPASQITELQFFCEQAGVCNIEVSDLSGKVITHITQNVTAGEQIISIPVQELTAGNYLVKVSGVGLNDVVKMSVVR